VITYDPSHSGGAVPTHPNFVDPSKSLGIPDFAFFTSSSVSLGSGGLLELEFLDNSLANSGDTIKDLHVFEIGSTLEDTFVAIRPDTPTAALLNPLIYDTNGDGFYEIGKVFGATSSIDIDSFFPPAPPGTYRFDAVQLIDDPAQGETFGDTVGADIDAVGAITSAPPNIIVGGTSIPIDTTSLLLAGASVNVWMIPVVLSAAGFGILIARKI